MAVDLSLLSEFVQRSERLIIPNVGAFFVRDSASGFRRENVTFSNFLRYDDGRLTELYAQHEGISSAEASQRSKEVIGYIRSELTSHGSCPLPGLGVLKLLGDGQVDFVAGDVPVPNVQLEEQSAGKSEALHTESDSALKPQQAAELSAAKTQAAGSGNRTVGGQRSGAATVQTRAQQRQKEAARHQQRPKGAVRQAPVSKQQSTSRPAGGAKVPVFAKFVLVLLALVVVVGAADFLWFGWVSPSLFPDVAPYFKVRTQRRLASAAEALSAKSTQEEEEMDAGASESVNEGEFSQGDTPLAEEFKNRTAAGSGAAEVAQSTPAVGVAKAANSGGKGVPSSARSGARGQGATSEEQGYDLPSEQATYHVVVGSFVEKENATRFSRELKQRGFASGIIEQPSGRNIVTVGSFGTLRAARRACSSMKDRFPDAWVLSY